tara:strand:+ start:277 stop:786 length:510 start_codon:yes stop_codon:yes gene_type:complete
MPRSVSTAARTAINAQETEEVFVLCLEVENELDPTQPIRVCLDSEVLTTKLTVDGVDTYSTAVPFAGGYFAIELPEEAGEELNTVSVSIDNVDRDIVTAIRNASEKPTVRLWVVLRSSPDVVEAGPYYMVLESAEYNVNFVTGELAFEDITNRRYPAHDFTPSLAPGLF